MSEFYMRLQKAMKEANIKQSELCEKTGIGKSSISQYLSGEYEPKQKNIYKLAKALNVSPSYLMEVDETDMAEEEQNKTHITFEDYLKSLGYIIEVKSIPSKAKYLEEHKDDAGNIVGKSWLPTKETAEYTLTKNDVVSTYTQNEFEKLKETNATLLNNEIYKHSLKNYVPETIAAHRTDDPTSELPKEARKSIDDFKKFIYDKHGIQYD